MNVRNNISNWRLNLLIGIHCFILFFLVFERFMHIPSWMQVVGRMHPVLLHFPIVLLLGAGLLVNFRSRLQRQLPLEMVIDETLFFAALSAGVTTVMGLLLAQEEGYEGGNLLWHKWTGVGVTFLSGALVYLRGWQYLPYRRAFTVITNICLIAVVMAGHYGAALTHGENFMWEPLRRDGAEAFDLQTAQVFDQAVLPILRAKCLSCHSAGKLKGGLNLSDSASIAKGGEHGPPLQPSGDAESLLIQRLMLDVEHEHHMPPKGKPQLTAEELDLLKAWVAKGAPYGLRVAALHDGDSLLSAIAAMYTIEKEESFDFPPADPAEVEKLSTPYRVIRAVSEGSPALSVSFFGAGFYSDQALADLRSLSMQIISLNVNGMPMGHQGVEAVASFKNLRSLHLNDTPVNDSVLAVLATLPKLRDISLSGTAVTASGIRHLLNNKGLRRVFLWNTAVGKEDAAQLASSFPATVIETGFVDEGQTVLPLTTPEIRPARTFFRDELQVSVSHPIPGVQIRYTLDGRDPDSLNSMVFDKPISIRSNQQLAVRAFKAGWTPSPTVTRKYVQSAKVPDRVVMEGRPHTLYPARRELSFFDLESGGYNHADGKWQGYYQSPLSASLYFNEPTAIDTLSLSVMQNYGGITYMPVYAPAVIEVWGGSDTTDVELLAKVTPVPGRPDQLETHRLIPCPIRKTNLRYLKVQAQPHRKIPDGFPAAGADAWMFVDEIVLK